MLSARQFSGYQYHGTMLLSYCSVGLLEVTAFAPICLYFNFFKRIKLSGHNKFGTSHISIILWMHKSPELGLLSGSTLDLERCEGCDYF